MKQKILVATANPGKITELRAMFGDNIQWVGLADFNCIGKIENYYSS